MKESSLGFTQITYSLAKILKEVRQDLEKEQNIKKRKKIRITKKEVCQELVRRCRAKRIV